MKEMEISSYQQYLFWNQLSEEIPDLSKLSEIGK
jgi:hypothetical protein